MIEAFIGFAVIGLPILIGYLVARWGIVNQAEGRALNRLAFFALIPILLFNLLSTADFRLLFSRLAWVSFCAALVMYLAYVLVARFVWRQPRGEVVVGALAAGYTNSNHIGLPIAVHILGNGTLVAPIVVFQTAIMAPVALALLESSQRSARRGTGVAPAEDGARGAVSAPETSTVATTTPNLSTTTSPAVAADHSRAAGRPVWRTVVGALANPIVLGSLLGVLWSGLGWPLPPLVREPLALVGAAAVPVILIAFGISLRGRTLLAPGPSRSAALYASALKMIAMPAAAFVLGRYVFGLDPAAVRAVTTLAALPTAQNVFNYANRYDQGLVLARDSISLTTLAAAPVILAITWLMT